RSRLDLVDREAERAGGAVADGADDLVHSAAARCDEHAFGVEDGVEPVGAEAGVLTNAAVVEDGELDAVVGGAPVWGTFRVLLVPEAGSRARSVAVRFECRLAAAAEGHLRLDGHLLAEPVEHSLGAGDQVGAVVGAADTGFAATLEHPQLLEALLNVA